MWWRVEGAEEVIVTNYFQVELNWKDLRKKELLMAWFFKTRDLKLKIHCQSENEL